MTSRKPQEGKNHKPGHPGRHVPSRSFLVLVPYPPFRTVIDLPNFESYLPNIVMEHHEHPPISSDNGSNVHLNSSPGQAKSPRPQMSQPTSFEVDIRMPTQQEVAAGHPLIRQGVPLTNTCTSGWSTAGACTPYSPLTPPTEFPSHDATVPLTRMGSPGHTQKLNPFDISIHLDYLKVRLEAAQRQAIDTPEAHAVSDARLTQEQMEQREESIQETAPGKSKIWSNALSRYRKLKDLFEKLIKIIRRRSMTSPRGQVSGRPPTSLA